MQGSTHHNKGNVFVTGDDFRHLFFDSPDMLCILTEDSIIQHANPALQEKLGWRLEELDGQSFFDFVHPEDLHSSKREIEALRTHRQDVRFSNRFLRVDGAYQAFAWSMFHSRESNLLYGKAHDITVQEHHEEDFRLVFEASPVAMLLVRQDGTIRMANRGAEELLGYSQAELIGEPVEKLVPVRFKESHRLDRTKFNSEPVSRPMGADRHLVAVCSDGAEIKVEIGLTPLQLRGEDYVLGTILDLASYEQSTGTLERIQADLRKANIRLTKLAMTDKLTGLRNRMVFDEQLAALLKLMRRMYSSLSLLMIDIDYFKRYNDQYGHPAGDDVLKQVAEILLSNCRISDIVTRYGGEEFAILLPDTRHQGAINVGEKIRQSVQDYAWALQPVTVSVGVSTMMFRKGTVEFRVDDAATLLSQADQALYHSKQAGRNQTSHFSKLQTA
jgi:diguanylate cyclase (GGDEF)-like protein/PAS domain S-box-containing protein